MRRDGSTAAADEVKRTLLSGVMSTAVDGRKHTMHGLADTSATVRRCQMLGIGGLAIAEARMEAIAAGRA